MAKIKISRVDGYPKVLTEQQLVRNHFPFLNPRIRGMELTCRGWVRPSATSQEYRVEIKYLPWNSPDVRILDPKIGYIPQAHMYKSGCLCLYDWRDQPWQDRWHLHETVIPWTAEWLVFYEIYMLTGKWIGKSAIHTVNKSIELPATNGNSNN